MSRVTQLVPVAGPGLMEIQDEDSLSCTGAADHVAEAEPFMVATMA